LNDHAAGHDLVLVQTTNRTESDYSSSDRRSRICTSSRNIHLVLVSSSKKPIVAFRKKILNPKNTPVQDLFTEVNDRHFWLS
jgi:hypothetical protein